MTTTDVHVLFNSNSIFGGSVTGFGSGSERTFSTTISVVPGNTIDFTVGFGNGSYNFDATQVIATITPVPEPATLTMFLIGFTLLYSAKAGRKA